MPGTPKSYKENTFMITEKIFEYCGVFNHSFAENIFLKFKDFSRTSHNIIFQFSRTFQGDDAFSRTFQGPCEPCMFDCVIDSVSSGVLKHYTHP